MGNTLQICRACVPLPNTVGSPISLCRLHAATGVLKEACKLARQAATEEWLYQTQGEGMQERLTSSTTGSVCGKLADLIPVLTMALAKIEEEIPNADKTT